MLPKVIDLFSGCGGMALGFEKVGFDIAGGVELKPSPCQTAAYNLDYRYGREKTHLCEDIRQLSPDVFKSRIGTEGCIVIGGPPCQAYSLAGKAKLRSLGDDRVNTKDSRGFLYQDYLRFVYELDAKAVIMENVPESVHFGEMNIPETVCESLEKHGYRAQWTILNSADYGVPQVRERVFVAGIKRGLKYEIALPVPTHRSSDDYQTAYGKRLKSFLEDKHFVMPNDSGEGALPWVTVRDAFSDLPVLFPDENSKYRNTKLNEDMPYRTEPQNEFQKKMRNWYNSESMSITANAFRNNRRDFAIFARMKQGDDYTDASRIADELFRAEARTLDFKPGSLEYKNLERKMVPVYARDKFETKWVRLPEERPSRTVTAHLSKDTYSHIHPTEPRGITVREAARLQSFPDDFFFDCSMGDAFEQIGNAVPPLLSYAVAKTVAKAFEEV